MKIERMNKGRGLFVGSDEFYVSINDEFGILSMRFWRIFYFSIGDKF